MISGHILFLSSEVQHTKINKQLQKILKRWSDATWTPNQTLIVICIVIHGEIRHILQNIQNIFCLTVFKNHAVMIVLEIIKEIERKEFGVQCCIRTATFFHVCVHIASEHVLPFLSYLKSIHHCTLIRNRSPWISYKSHINYDISECLAQ